jgi:microcystin-dependent protein
LSEPFIGETRAFPYDFIPQGWAPCQGQLLPIPEYVPLFTLLSTRYGGDGSTCFGLPKIEPLAAENGTSLTWCIALTGLFPQRP